MSLARYLFNELQSSPRFYRPFEDPFFNTAGRDGFGFGPRSDVKETESEYVVEAEVPGYRKEDINIEFVDNRTLQISGKIARETSTGYPPSSSANQQKATIESVPDEAEGTSGGGDEQQQQVATTTTAQQQQVSTPTYHSTERVFGSFSRSFVLPGNFDQSQTSAKLENGILSVVVPKLTGAGSKKIAIV